MALIGIIGGASFLVLAIDLFKWRKDWHGVLGWWSDTVGSKITLEGMDLAMGFMVFGRSLL